MEGLKTCSSCKAIKPLSDFHRDAQAPDGRRNHCRECKRKQQKEYWESGRAAAARRANPVASQLATMLKHSKNRAKDKNIEHDIDLAYLRSIFTTHCPYLGIKLRWKVVQGLGMTNRAFPNSPSLDRIDSSKGYVKGNVIIVSHRANSIKRDATEQELYRIGRALSLLKASLAFP